MQMVYCGPCPLGSTSPIKVGAWLYNFTKCSIKIVVGTFSPFMSCNPGYLHTITLHISSNGTHNSTHNLKTDTHNSTFFGKKVPLNNSTSPYVKPIK